MYRERSKYQTAWHGIKGISAVQRSGDGKRLLPDGLSSAGGSWSLHRGGRTQGCRAQWGCSKMTFHIQICHSNGISATFKTARMASLTSVLNFSTDSQGLFVIVQGLFMTQSMTVAKGPS